MPEPTFKGEQDDFRIKLISILAHDFRGAFMNIISLMDFYKKGQVPPERFDMLFSELKSTSQNNLRSFENTLKWVKTRLKGYTYKAVAINASEALQESIKNNISEIKRKKISLTIKGDEEGCIIYADPQLLGFVLNNLLNNAVKYSYPGTVIECIIESGGDRPDKMVKVQIVDYGVGMDTETRDAIFCHEKTIYTGTAGEKGAGIALLICKDFVDIQQGTLEIASEPGNGSVFTLTIPGETGKTATVFCNSEPGSYYS
ncbi:sensor histidine kinase [Anseongella ginsenosidimutans]|nr:HAMP domain-containing sensor histidine kinase [Anseongella ginsenosidimutans]